MVAQPVKLLNDIDDIVVPMEEVKHKLPPGLLPCLLRLRGPEHHRPEQLIRISSAISNLP